MGFKVSASDMKEIIEYLTNQCSGNNVDFNISPGESYLNIKTFNKRNEEVTIYIYPEDKSIFPKLTKSMRLKEDK